MFYNSFIRIPIGAIAGGIYLLCIRHALIYRFQDFIGTREFLVALKKTEDALDFVRRVMNAPINRIAVEQPMSCVSSRIRKFDQAIQPYDFGEDASKTTWLWLKNLPLLIPTLRIPGRKVMYKDKERERWSNQTDSGQNRLAPSPTRARDRAKTYQGIADAMAKQWGWELSI